MNETELLAEKKRTEIWIADARMNTPQPILEQSNDYKVAVDYLTRVNEQLLVLTQAEEAKEQEKAAQKVAELSHMVQYLDKLYWINQDLKKIHPSSNGGNRAAEISRQLSQILRNHQPATPSPDQISEREALLNCSMADLKVEAERLQIRYKVTMSKKELVERILNHEAA